MSRWCHSHERPSLISWCNFLRWSLARHAVRAGQREHEEGGHEERGAVEQERQRGEGDEQQRPQRRTGEGLRQDLGGRQAAVGRSSWGRSTTLGRMACEALSNMVCAVPRANPTTQSSGIELWWVATATASTAMVAKRQRSAMPMTRRRSSRSTRAPAISAKSAHGRPSATVTAATARGRWVIPAASRGSAAKRTPSPMAEMPDAVQTRQKRLPSATSAAAERRPRRAFLTPGAPEPAHPRSSPSTSSVPRRGATARRSGTDRRRTRRRARRARPRARIVRQLVQPGHEDLPRRPPTSGRGGSSASGCRRRPAGR